MSITFPYFNNSARGSKTVLHDNVLLQSPEAFAGFTTIYDRIHRDELLDIKRISQRKVSV